jgi:hypothetical protein
MLWKILLTAGLILVAYFTFKARLRGPLPMAARDSPTLWASARRPIRVLAIGLLVLMALGTGWYLWHGWEHANQILTVQVANANTGAIVSYEARRRDIDGRVIRTLDGREIRMADVERMILTEPKRGR